MHKRIVVKIGTGVISKENGKINERVIKHIVEETTRLRRKKIEVVLVTSGAVGTGRGLFALKNRPDSTIGKQAYAAVGQVKLMGMYAEHFAKNNIICAQVLATKEDFRDKEHYLNMKNCLENLLRNNVVPVVNENDVVAISELVFTDNDELAGLVASQLNADAVIILTGVDGVLADSRVIREIGFAQIASFRKYITKDKSSFGRGGMRTKFDIAKKLSAQGITTHIANGHRRSVIVDIIIRGMPVGTKFLPRKKLSVPTMRTIQKTFGIAILAAFFLMPLSASAAVKYKPFEISGWIPYWRAATGTVDAMAHLDTFTEVNPFGYTVKTNGTLYDAAKLGEAPWPEFIAAAKAKNIRVIPTVMWSNGEAIHRILSNQKTRIALEDEIAAVVKKNGFDGIDIDFEGKKAETKQYFSTFLKGLYQRMGNKWVMCTIEARTPIADRYHGTTPPKDAGLYANDFVAINKYCDRVRIMAYDQQSIDLKLNTQEDGKLYAPVADPRWVEKAVALAAQTISKKKIVIGVPTYGYEYDVTAYADGYTYDLLWSFNPGYALPIASAYGIIPGRNSANEMSFSYLPTSTAPIAGPEGTTTPIIAHDQLAKAAQSVASSTNSHLTFRLMWWSDAQAIKDKIALAKKLGVRGVAIFKIDGGQDPGIWDVLK